jgi:hypothetical protein
LGLILNLLRISDKDHLSYIAQMPSQLPAGTNLNSPQIKLLKEWNDAFAEMNIAAMKKLMHKDFRRSVYPRSLGEPEQNAEEAFKELSGLFGVLTGVNVGHTFCYSNLLPRAKSTLQMTVHSIIEAPERIVVHVRIPFLSSQSPHLPNAF